MNQCWIIPSSVCHSHTADLNGEGRHRNAQRKINHNLPTLHNENFNAGLTSRLDAPSSYLGDEPPAGGYVQSLSMLYNVNPQLGGANAWVHTCTVHVHLKRIVVLDIKRSACAPHRKYSGLWKAIISRCVDNNSYRIE